MINHNKKQKEERLQSEEKWTEEDMNEERYTKEKRCMTENM